MNTIYNNNLNFNKNRWSNNEKLYDTSLRQRKQFIILTNIEYPEPRAGVKPGMGIIHTC